MELMVYLIKANIAIVLFYGIYRLLFQQDTFFQWKRLALLAVIFISFLYPAINLTRQMIANHQLKAVLETVQIPVYTLPELVVTGNVKASVNFFPQVVLAIYLLVSGLLLIRMLFQLGTIAYKLRKTDKKVLFGHAVYESPGLKTPFSFFKWIVLDSSRYSEAELQEILLHETTHAKQGHSADTLLAEFLCALCWFNPFAWLLKTEIRMNLEFLADRSVLSSGCEAEHYQFHLLHLSYHKAAAKITNNFNVSLLKKRIFMMNKKQTSYRSMWKYALMLPVVAMLLLLNSSFQTKAEPVNEMSAVQQNPAPAKDNPAPAQNKSQVLSHSEIMPQFPGGEAALLKFLADKIIYPKEAQDKGIQGRVSVRFVVTPDGSIENVKVVKGFDPSCDKEAVRVVKTMPKWIPGKQDGKQVSVYYSLPVVFRLQGGKDSVNEYPGLKSTQTVNTIVQIDGKVVSEEEWKNADPKKLEFQAFVKEVNPTRMILIFKTKQ